MTEKDVEHYYASFQPWLLGYARMLDPSSAEDAVQEAFAALSTRLDRPPPVENVQGYLVRIVQRRQHRAYRDRARETKRPWLRWLDRDAAVHHDRYADPDLARGLRNLSEQQRACVALRFGKDLTVPAIATLLELHESTVKTHINRALSTLRAELGESDDDAT